MSVPANLHSDNTQTPEPLAWRSGQEVFTTSETIATHAGVSHQSILKTLDKHSDSLERFGQIGIEFRPGYNNAPIRYAVLNEDQATLALTFLRNTPPVVRFKADLVHAFSQLKNQTPQTKPHSLEARALAVISELSTVVEEQQAELETAMPKAEAYDQFMDADGTYSVGNVARMLGTSQNKLFAALREARVLMTGGNRHNIPYQHYMHHFSVKASSFQVAEGMTRTSHTTRVKPSGIEFIRKKLGLDQIPGQKPEQDLSNDDNNKKTPLLTQHG